MVVDPSRVALVRGVGPDRLARTHPSDGIACVGSDMSRHGDAACDNRVGMPAHVRHDERGGGRRAVVVGMLAYLGLALVMFAHLLWMSATRATTCACADSSLFAWFFEWPLAALRQGHNPVFSAAMFHPQGINLLSNTSVTAWSFVLLPITWIWGPVASLNVALVAAPVLSATSAMWVARRWVRSGLAAFVGGALYGFSPFVLFQEAGAHLMVTSLFVPPLVLACLDELLVRRRRPPVLVGLLLGLCFVLQFFLGTEVLVMLVVATALSLVVLGLGALVVDRAALAASLRGAFPGLAVALGVAGALLAWPLWYALAGPEHLSGDIWPYVTPAQASVRSFVQVVPGQGLWWTPHWGRFMRPTYLGPPLLATLVVGLVVWRRDVRLWCSIAIGAIVAWLALGARYWFGAWHYLQHLPVLHNVMNERFSALLFLPIGLSLAIVLDHVAQWGPKMLRNLAALAVAAACVAPFAINAAAALPYAASNVWEPQWYASAADRLPAGQVVLGFPFFTTTADLLAVQALHGMHYAIAGGTGPEWINSRQGKSEEPGYVVIKDLASVTADPSLPAHATAREADEVRAALRGWGVTDVVDPMESQPKPWGSQQPRTPWAIAVWMSSVLGQPSTVDDAWVWHLTP